MPPFAFAFALAFSFACNTSRKESRPSPQSSDDVPVPGESREAGDSLLAEPLELPAEGSRKEPAPDIEATLEIVLSPEGSSIRPPRGEPFEVEGGPGRIGEPLRRLAGQGLSRETTQVLLTGSGVDYQAVVHAMDAAMAAGFRRMTLGRRARQSDLAAAEAPGPTDEPTKAQLKSAPLLIVTRDRVKLGDVSVSLRAYQAEKESTAANTISKALKAARTDDGLLVFQMDKATPIEVVLDLAERADRVGFASLQYAVNRSF